jgi:hypothetical protein
MLERHEGSFIAPQGNLANEVSEIQTCLGRGLDKEPDKAGCDLATEELGLGQTCPVQEPNMFD